MQVKSITIDDASLIIIAAKTITATENEATFDLGSGDTFTEYPLEQVVIPMIAKLVVTSYSTTNGNETYAFKVQTSPDGTTWTDYSRIATLGAGTPTDGSVVPNTGGILQIGFFSNNRYVRIVSTLGGTSPSIVLANSYLNPLTNPFGG